MVAEAANRSGLGPDVSISSGDFEQFREYFYRATGIYWDHRKQDWVARTIRRRMEAAGFDDFTSYFQHLRLVDDGSEFNRLVGGLTIKETYFFREDYQFRCLVESVLPEVMGRKAPGEPVRIWTVPCSTGEEPYSIAIYLLEYWPEVDHVDVEITATELDMAALERAREGIYGAYAVRNLTPDVLARYFSPVPHDQYRICRPLRDSLDFRAGNLVDPSVVADLPPFDIIFCRNLLIYFDDRSRRQAAQNLFDALAPEGFVFLGHAESMSRISNLFRPRRFPAAFAYQKPGGTV
jgi:chemotaxis protein methyltransferase CheR